VDLLETKRRRKGERGGRECNLRAGRTLLRGCVVRPEEVAGVLDSAKMVSIAVRDKVRSLSAWWSMIGQESWLTLGI
jgi:hypothetical protein